MREMKKETWIKKCMKYENCTREDAEKHYQIKLEFESPNFTIERGKELYKELDALRKKNTSK